MGLWLSSSNSDIEVMCHTIYLGSSRVSVLCHRHSERLVDIQYSILVYDGYRNVRIPVDQ